MHTMRAYSEPLHVEAFAGEVVIRDSHGPTGLSLTPKAAMETARLLTEAAQAASIQASQDTPGED
jgi:hypothetical protein